LEVDDMDKKLIYLTVDQDEADETRVEKVSFVDSPAIQRGWMAFKNHQRFKVQSEDRRIVSGALMVAGLPIYRRDDSGEYYVSFTASAIQAIVYKFMKENRTKEVNEMHETDVDGVFLFESFIIDQSRGIKTPEGFDELPDGSWFGSFKVENDEVWKKVKDGTYTGFSVEGMFTEDMEKNIDERVLAEVIRVLTETN
jgi:L-ribulose-5-phosphate 3-epimerase UlaE